MWVESDGITFISSVEKVSVFVGESKESTPTCIDVVPKFIFLTDFGDVVLVVESSHDGGSGNGVDEEWCSSSCDIFGDGGIEEIEVHGSGVFDGWDHSNVVHAHS